MDGSGLPDKVMGFFTNCEWEDITYKCCLPHDLCYGYGELGNEIEMKYPSILLSYSPHHCLNLIPATFYPFQLKAPVK